MQKSVKMKTKELFLKDFAAFILTNGRPDNVRTYDALRAKGYTGRVVIIIDDQDKKREAYISKFKNEVVVFDKKEQAKTFDTGDNFNDMRAIVYARNASFDIAKKLGIKYFIQLDDDYTNFSFRFNENLDYRPRTLKSLDAVFNAMVKFFVNSGCDTFAMSQGGDWMGGEDSPKAEKVQLLRKAMNSFICSTDRPFKFVGRINEDVNTYTYKTSLGLLMLTTNQLSLQQMQTQKNSGGMTEMYLDSGTYIKSFYSVMYHPSGVKVKILHSKNKRLHHGIRWKYTAPMILRETTKK